MKDEIRPLRQLKRFEKLRVWLGRCPTCNGAVERVPQDDIASWHNFPPPGYVSRQWGAGAEGRMMKGHITQLQHRKIPRCPKCNHTFVHGWIYPAAANANPSGTG